MIGLVACCKTKLPCAAPARELYTSPLFRLSLAYAERSCSAVYIASAQHDLVELGRVLGPYERTIGGLSATQRKLFGAAVARGLVDRHGSAFELLALAGAAYVEPVRIALAHMGASVEIREPLAGMQIGERLSFLSARLTDPRPHAAQGRPPSATNQARAPREAASIPGGGS